MSSFVLGLHGGWGARFSMLGAAFLQTAKSNRNLRVYWDHQYTCAWAEISDYPLELVGAREWQDLQKWLSVRDWRMGDLTWSDEVEGMEEFDQVSVSATCIPRNAGFSFSDAIQAFKSRVSLARVAERSIFKGLDAESMIGVHIRGTDYEEAKELSPPHLFRAAMQEYPPGTSFFVCTDAPEIGEAVDTWGFRVQQAPYASRRSSEGLFTDLDVLLTLARCKKVLGCPVSSFARFAAAWGDTTLQVVSH